MLQMVCSHSYALNKNVFSLRLNMSSPTVGVQQEDCFMNAVPGRRNCGRLARPGAGNSESAGVSKPETSAGDG